jgi:hypothetical protein
MARKTVSPDASLMRADLPLSIRTNVAGEIVFASVNEAQEFMLVNSARVSNMLGLVCVHDLIDDAMVRETLNAANDLAWQVEQAAALVVLSRGKAPSDETIPKTSKRRAHRQAEGVGHG